jgi:hypothetical protein
MVKIAVKEGDLFLIPFGDKKAVGKILWISKRTKNVFSFIVKNELAKTADEASAIAKTKKNISVKIFSGTVNVFYTDISKIKKGEWAVIGNIPLTEEESENLQYHNIGGVLFKGDEEIRPLKGEEFTSIPKMLIAGYEAVSNYLKIAFTNL